MTNYSLGDFLRDEMNRRGMSANKFAEFIGVSHTSINKFLEYGEQDIGYPSVEFVVKLARATNTDAGYVMSLIEPDVTMLPVHEMDERTLLHAKKYNRLSDNKRELVERFVQLLDEATS